MKRKLMKTMSIAFVFALVGFMGNSAEAALTIAATSITSDGAVTINGVAGSVYAIGAATTTGTITIGGTAQTGTVSLGASTGALTLNLGTGGTGIKTINMGTGATANVVTVGSVTGAASLDLLFGSGDFTIDGAAAGTITIGDTAQTGTITIGDSSATLAIEIGTGEGATTLGLATGATAANTVNIATGAITGNTVNVGSTTGASTVRLNAGTAGIQMTGNLISIGTVPAVAQLGAGTATIDATSTDTAGQVHSDANAGVTGITVTFNGATSYTTAPICMVSPVDADAAAAAGSATGVYADATTTVLTITWTSQTAATDWNYFCIENV